MKWISLTTCVMVLVVSCRSTSSSSSHVSSSSSVPPVYPTSDFYPWIDDRQFLIATTATSTYHVVNQNSLTPLPLSPVNFPRVEDQVTMYAEAAAEVGDFSSQSLVFTMQLPDVSATLANTPINQPLNEQQTMAVLEAWQRSDERFNEKRTTIKERNLSYAFLEGDYYWFNHYVLEEAMIMQRYSNHVVYGEWVMNKTFQTELNIQPRVAYQHHVDGQYIHEIRDETFPSGFFGAFDTYFRTVRTADNARLALTLGPLTEMMLMWNMVEKNLVPPSLNLHHDIEEFNRQLSLTKINENTLRFDFQLIRPMGQNQLEEEWNMVIALTPTGIQQSIQTHYLWAPPVS